MLRVLIEYVVPLALPSLLYFIWLAYRNRQIARGGEGAPQRWQEGPWAWLIVGGVLLAVIAGIVVSMLRGYGTEGRYVPPRVEDGRIIPGHVEPVPRAR